MIYPACSPPVQSSGYATLGTPDGTGTAAESVGQLRMRILLGNPSTSADEADVRLVATVSDVFRLGTSEEYTDPLTVSTRLRLTDRGSGSSSPGEDPGSVLDYPLTVPMPCTPTAEAEGSTCGVISTVDSLIPNFVIEGKRSVWQLAEVDVFDAGADGDPWTPDNTLFATQGLFVP
jgi:hypothetical protein